MKHIVNIIFIFLSFQVIADDRESLLSAWEEIQKTSKQVEKFSRLEEGKYTIKFSVLPYNGKLNILTYDTEEINYDFIKDNPYTKRGYVNVDLVDAKEETLAKYGRTYYKWFESNTLYFNKNTGAWESSDKYNKYITKRSKEFTNDNIFTSILGYWEIILILIFVYIIYTSIAGGRLVKKSVKLQNDAMHDMEEMKRVSGEAISLQKEANKLLTEILDELRKNK